MYVLQGKKGRVRVMHGSRSWFIAQRALCLVVKHAFLSPVITRPRASLRRAEALARVACLITTLIARFKTRLIPRDLYFLQTHVMIMLICLCMLLWILFNDRSSLHMIAFLYRRMHISRKGLLVTPTPLSEFYGWSGTSSFWLREVLFFSVENELL